MKPILPAVSYFWLWMGNETAFVPYGWWGDGLERNGVRSLRVVFARYLLMSCAVRPAFSILRDALLVALLTALALALAYQVRLRVFVDLGGVRDGFFLQGFFDAEDDQTQTYRWTRGDARVTLEGQQLATPYILTMRLNGYRPNRPAKVDVKVNHAPLQAFEASGAWELYDMESDVGADAWTGTTTFEIASDTFVPHEIDPNNSDTRPLGVAIDRLEWMPARSPSAIGSATAWIDLGRPPIVPPGAVVLSWAAALGILYAIARGIGLAARPVNLLFGALILLLAPGIAVWRPYVATFTGAFLTLALVLAALAVALVWLLPRLARRFSFPLTASAQAVLCAIALLSVGLKWGGAWYPQYRSSDLLFHAHRLEFVAEGNLFFTSELPDAARRVVPYPPALYVVLTPIAPWVSDLQGLLLIANVLFDVIGILAIFFTARTIYARPDAGQIERVSDGHATRYALFTTFLFAFNPVSFWIYSWGNHTNIFGQLAATLLFCVLLTQPLTRPRNFLLALFFLALASIAHLGVFLSLAAFLPLAAVLRFLMRDTDARREGIALSALLLAGIVLSALAYYGEFADLLVTQTRAFIGDFGAGRAAGEDGLRASRVTDVLRYTWEQVGWVLLLCGMAGIPLAWKRFTGRVRAVWLAWLVVALVFGLVTIGSTFSTRYTLWAAPALALSGGLVLLWLFERSRAAQFAAYALCAFALAQTLWLWIDRVLYGYQ